MTGNTVNGSENGARSGAQTLILLAAPLNVRILRMLADGPKQQAELRRETGSPAQTTLRAQLKRLTTIGAIEQHRRNRFPGVVEYELAPPGTELLFILFVIENWLVDAPGGPLAPTDNAAKAAIKALAEGWSTTILRALAARPLSLTELDGIIGSLNYPSLERRLGAMRLAGQVKASKGNGNGKPYTVTNWLRRGVAVIASAARWERRHLPQSTAPFSHLDIEAAFLLAVPLLQIPEGLSGTCRLAAEISNASRRRLAGVVAELQSDGRVGPCITRLQGHADAWALGSPTAWLNAVIDRDTANLELGGNRRLASAFLDGLNSALFKIRIQSA